MTLIPNYVPSSYKTINICLLVKDAEKAIRFYNSAFGADEVMRLTDSDGRIVHSEIKIADTIIMLSEDRDLDESTKSRIKIILYTGDVEGMLENALKAGAQCERKVEKQFYGDRTVKLIDPFGLQWTMATHMEDLTVNQVKLRFDELHS